MEYGYLASDTSVRVTAGGIPAMECVCQP